MKIEQNDLLTKNKDLVADDIGTLRELILTNFIDKLCYKKYCIIVMDIII